MMTKDCVIDTNERSDTKNCKSAGGFSTGSTVITPYSFHVSPVSSPAVPYVVKVGVKHYEISKKWNRKKRLPSYYGDLPNLGNQYSEEEQHRASSHAEIALVLRSQVRVPLNDSEQQFWADNELESESSTLFQQVPTNLQQSSSQHSNEKHSSSTRKMSTEKQNTGNTRRRPMKLSTTLPSSSGKVPSCARKSKIKRKLLSYSPTPSSSSSGDSNPSINNGNKNALLCCSPSDLNYQGCAQMCWRCKSHPQNAVFIHGSIGHQCYCYHCAYKLWRTKGNCPICQQRIKRIVKIVAPRLNSWSKIISKTNVYM